MLVALGNVLYIWNAGTGDAEAVYEIDQGNYITSVKWNQKADILSCGNSLGEILLYDPFTLKLITKIQENNFRIGTLSWNNNILTTGGKDKIIRNYDIRCP